MDLSGIDQLVEGLGEIANGLGETADGLTTLKTITKMPTVH